MSCRIATFAKRFFHSPVFIYMISVVINPKASNKCISHYMELYIYTYVYGRARRAVNFIITLSTAKKFCLGVLVVAK